MFAAIAVALVKLAFFPSTESEGALPLPTGNADDQVVAVSVGSIVNEISLGSTVVADPAVPARAGMIGEVGELSVAQGATVAKGAVLATIRQEIEQEPIVRTDAEGNTTTTAPKAKYRYSQVVAPEAGIISALPLIVGQAVAVGDTVAQIAPPTFSVTATIDPAQQFRLATQPTEARVSVVGGPAEFTCTGLTITAPLAGAAPGGDESNPGAPAAGNGPQVRCAVPADVRVFGGLSGKLVLPGGSAENVLVLPVTAVKGSSQSGSVWVMNAEGISEERPVSLGLNDGSLVQITEGLVEGDEVLEFIPVEDPTNGGPGNDCVEQPNGEIICGEEG
ncbi:efflux RND transporter periplasmic adaptor subunit [Mycetocola spongiae]|uniref:efflux RND transporter periplasmic adaptor subunit n=1 Tax=Mycetocola spongiae TaxID=2859226 RepID=UPI001CF41338|nr:HlyD family efflux transporter periplasmic adaptor subunit [Mycetocola spongiae]UCR90008.1 HlyD family efflux transporter periplasmic adaptor subunit [Mycetocola spongiae]